MPCEENSAAPGPQTRVGRTTYPERSRAQPDNPVFSPSDANILEQQCRRLCEDVRQTELRGCGLVGADQCMSWKSGEMSLDYVTTPESSVAANAGSPRGGTESDVAHYDGFQNDAGERHDSLECLRGVDPNDSSATLESCPYSTHDLSDELSSTMQDTESSGRLENGVNGEGRG